MRFVDNELDISIDRLQERTLDWLIQGIKWRKLTGDIGEKFIGICICHTLWKLGYTLDLTNRPYSYNIKPKYKANPDGYRGVDFFLSIIDSEEITQIYLIEVKNWNHYDISRHTYNEDILSRFTRIDELRHCKWILTMNQHNIPQISRRCQNYGIEILELPSQITPYEVFNCEIIEKLYRGFIDRFCSMITGYSNEREYPYLVVENRNYKPIWSMIDQDLLMGVPYEVIKSRYNTTMCYIYKCASDLRRWYPALPDRRNKDWSLAWDIQI